MKRKPLEPWQEEDAGRLMQLYAQRTTLSQQEFGERFGIGTQGAVWQYLNGRIPLNLEAAVKFARGLGVALAEISPTLAGWLQEVRKAGFVVGEDINGELRYLLHARFPELSEAEVAEIIGYAKGIARSKKPGTGI